VDFSREEPKVVKFHFTHSKLRKNPFSLKLKKFNKKMSNFKIQGSKPPSDAHG